MAALFGTDGVRGVANEDLTPDLVLALGRAAAAASDAAGRDVVVGRDTRVSGPMLESALVAGLASGGANALTAGIVPTAAVAWLTADLGAAAGAVISASHNPVEDNGVKFFGPDGAKASDKLEESIERAMEIASAPRPTGVGVGTCRALEDAVPRYSEHLVTSTGSSLSGLRIVLDCAYGAAFRAAPLAFTKAGADVVSIHDEPDGTRINVDCGATSPAVLARAVVSEKADVGFAFDGDADRVIAVDERGGIVDGDRILAWLAFDMADTGSLDGNVVVSTVMANLGFRRALEGRGLTVVAAPVGDRFVAREMQAHGAVLGGEQSGHVILARHAATGDGILTALKVAEALVTSGRRMSSAGDLFETFPQELVNVRVKSRDGLEGARRIWDEVERTEAALGAEGRVLVRASGTEPLVRVMVEASDAGVARRTAHDLAAVVEAVLG